jgi:hypothetical protein
MARFWGRPLLFDGMDAAGNLSIINQTFSDDGTNYYYR